MSSWSKAATGEPVSEQAAKEEHASPVHSAYAKVKQTHEAESEETEEQPEPRTIPPTLASGNLDPRVRINTHRETNSKGKTQGREHKRHE